MPQPLVSVERNYKWTNKHQNVSLTVERFFDVYNLWTNGTAPQRMPFKAGLAGIQAVVRTAEAEGKRVRGLGGEWSLSQAAATQDFMVNTKPLNFVELGFRQSSVHPDFGGSREALVFAQCGASVLELNQYLESRGYSLPTSGASNGQTIVGAISTGTHGSANRVGSMQDYILGLHIVAEGGQHYWVERASSPVVSERFVKALGAELRRDDRLFEAALVSFGSFGLIHAVLFEAEPIFLMERYVKRFGFPRVIPTLTSLDVAPLQLEEGAKRPFHYEVIVNPYKAGRGQNGCFVRYMYKRPFDQMPSRRPSTDGFTAGDDVMSLFGHITGFAPDMAPAIVTTALDSQMSEVSAVTATHGQTFGTTSMRGLVMSTEIGVALQDAEDAMDAVVEVANRFPWGGLAAVRYVKGSKASLAFTRFSPISCTIELPSVGSARTLEAFERVWDELEHRGIIYTLHWGQSLRCDAARLRAAYGRRLTQWLNARRGFLTPQGRRTFANGMIVSCGLAD